MVSRRKLKQELEKQRKMIIEDFVGPLKIYRYYGARMTHSPYFLQRNLSYMKGRMSRRAGKKDGFKVDHLFERMQPKNMIITGVTDGQIWLSDTEAMVDIMYAQVSHDTDKATKISEKSVSVQIHSPELPTSPMEINVPPPPGSPIVIGLIPAVKPASSKSRFKTDLFMIVRVTLPRICLSPIQSKVEDDGKPKRNKLLAKGEGEGGEFVTYMGSVCLAKGKEKIIDSDINVMLKRVGKIKTRGTAFEKKFLLKNWSWEVVDTKQPKFIEQMNAVSSAPGKSAIVSVAIRGSTDEIPKPIKELPLLELKKKSESSAAFIRMIYCYVAGPDSQSLSLLELEARSDLCCPWCSLKCLTLASLLKHLELCHSKFQFSFSRKFKPKDGKWLEEVCVYVSKRDAPDDEEPEDKSFMVRGRKPTDKEILRGYFGGDANESEAMHNVGIWHERVYYHSTTGMPVHPSELNVESDDDTEFVKHTQAPIDQFKDLNEGEKEFFKLWNRFMIKNNYKVVGNCLLLRALKDFVFVHGREVWEKNLYRNFCLHLCNLVDFDLLTADKMDEIIQEIVKLRGQGIN